MFRCGSFSQNVRVRGLWCPSIRTHAEFSQPACGTCVRAALTFPLDSVVNFDNPETLEEKDRWRTKRASCLSVCLARPQIEDIVESRAGSRTRFLHLLGQRFLHLLGQGRRYMVSSDRTPLYIVTFSARTLREIKRVIDRAPLDVKNISQQDVHRAIMRSFANDWGDPPSQRCCLINLASINRLRDLGVPMMNNEDLQMPVFTNATLLPAVANGIIDTGHDTSTRTMCIWLLRSMLKHQSFPICQVVDPAIFRKMNQLLRPENSCPVWQQLAVESLAFITYESTLAHIQLLGSTGVIWNLVFLLRSPHRRVAHPSACSLCHIAKKSPLYREVILESGALRVLLAQTKKWRDQTTLDINLQLFEALCLGVASRNAVGIIVIGPYLEALFQLISSDDVNVLSYACRVLCAIHLAFGDRLGTISEILAFPRLLVLVSHPSPRVLMPALSVVEALVNKSQIQLIVNSSIFPALIMYMSDEESSICLKAYRLICKLLTKGTCNQIDALVGQVALRPLASFIFQSANPSFVSVSMEILAKVSAFFTEHWFLTRHSTYLTSFYI